MALRRGNMTLPAALLGAACSLLLGAWLGAIEEVSARVIDAVDYRQDPSGCVGGVHIRYDGQQGNHASWDLPLLNAGEFAVETAEEEKQDYCHKTGASSSILFKGDCGGIVKCGYVDDCSCTQADNPNGSASGGHWSSYDMATDFAVGDACTATGHGADNPPVYATCATGPHLAKTGCAADLHVLQAVLGGGTLVSQPDLATEDSLRGAAYCRILAGVRELIDQSSGCIGIEGSPALDAAFDGANQAGNRMEYCLKAGGRVTYHTGGSTWDFGGNASLEADDSDDAPFLQFTGGATDYCPAARTMKLEFGCGTSSPAVAGVFACDYEHTIKLDAFCPPPPEGRQIDVLQPGPNGGCEYDGAAGEYRWTRETTNYNHYNLESVNAIIGAESFAATRLDRCVDVSKGGPFTPQSVFVGGACSQIKLCMGSNDCSSGCMYVYDLPDNGRVVGEACTVIEGNPPMSSATCRVGANEPLPGTPTAVVDGLCNRWGGVARDMAGADCSGVAWKEYRACLIPELMVAGDLCASDDLLECQKGCAQDADCVGLMLKDCTDDPTTNPDPNGDTPPACDHPAGARIWKLTSSGLSATSSGSAAPYFTTDWTSEFVGFPWAPDSRMVLLKGDDLEGEPELAVPCVPPAGRVLDILQMQGGGCVGGVWTRNTNTYDQYDFDGLNTLLAAETKADRQQDYCWEVPGAGAKSVLVGANCSEIKLCFGVSDCSCVAGGPNTVYELPGNGRVVGEACTSINGPPPPAGTCRMLDNEPLGGMPEMVLDGVCTRWGSKARDMAGADCSGVAWKEYRACFIEDLMHADDLCSSDDLLTCQRECALDASCLAVMLKDCSNDTGNPDSNAVAFPACDHPAGPRFWFLTNVSSSTRPTFGQLNWGGRCLTTSTPPIPMVTSRVIRGPRTPA
jgi:hypothetical protein